MVPAYPSQNQIAIRFIDFPPSDAGVCLLVRDRLVSLVTTMRMVAVHNVGVTDVLTKYRGRDLGSIRGVLVGDRRVASSEALLVT